MQFMQSQAHIRASLSPQLSSEALTLETVVAAIAGVGAVTARVALVGPDPIQANAAMSAGRLSGA